MNIVPMENIGNGSEECGEKKGTQDRTLWHNWGDWRTLGDEEFDLDDLSMARKVGLKTG